MEGRAQLQPGQMLGSYRIVRKIGHGGMGEVYEAWESELHRRIAIKILRVESLSDPEMTERFRGEGRALARLKHENVVTLYTLGEFNGRIYMAMEYIDGVPLDHFLMSHACSLGDVLSLVRQLLEGLGAAHEAGIIHRDLKPANVVIDKAMRAKLVDFGIAKVHSERSTGLETSREVIIGTVNYIAPEVGVGKPATIRSDIYSLGLVFFHMLSGMTPFIGRSNFETLEKIRTTALAFSPRLQNLIPQDVKRVVMKMTAKSPSMRYSSAQEALADLEKIDISKLPADLRQSTASGFPVVNYTEVRKRCETLGFDASELRFILAIASGIAVDQMDGGAEENMERTDKIDMRPLIEITEKSLNEAVMRFQRARSTLVARRVDSPAASRVHYSPPQDDLAQSLVTAICVMLVFGSGFYLYRFMGLRLQASSNRTFSSLAITPRTSLPASASTPAVPAVATQETVKSKGAELTIPKPGFTYSYSLTGTSSTETWTVKAGAAGHLIWENQSGDWESRTINPFLPPLEQHQAGRQILNQIGQDPIAIFPLTEGKQSINHIIHTDETGRISEFDWRCQVGEENQLDLRAGQFETWSVTCEGGSLESRHFQFSPLLGHWVRAEESGKVLELIGYSKAP